MDSRTSNTVTEIDDVDLENMGLSFNLANDLTARRMNSMGYT